MDPETARIEHLKLIQAIIERMARNSFAVRAIASTIVAGLVAVTFGADVPVVAAFGAGPVALLWAIDGYYLSAERQFRLRYDHARIGVPPAPGSESYFAMGVKVAGGGWRGVFGAMFSRPGILFYVSLFLVLAVVATVAAV